MKYSKKIASLILVMCMIFQLSACQKVDERTKSVKELKLSEPVTITVWYKDSDYEKYLDLVAERVHAANELVSIEPVYIESGSYVEDIYDESIRNDNACDIYLMTSEEVEKAYLMGLMLENDLYKDIYNADIYGDAAITACSYKDKMYGYPVSFNTSFLIYNADHAEEVETFEEIQTISDNYVVTEENMDITMVFQWPPSSMFLNYALVGSYLNVGGENSEDSNDVSIEGEKVKLAMNGFSKLNSVFGMDRSTVTLEDTVELFTEDGLLYSIVDADSIPAINQSGVNYGVCEYPKVDKDLESKPISITTMAVVNPYTKNVDASKAVARAISYDYADYLENTAGVCCARGDLKLALGQENYDAIHEIYADSVVKAKYIGVGEVYLRLEILLHQVYDGTNVDEAYESFSGVMKPVTSTENNTEAETK